MGEQVAAGLCKQQLKGVYNINWFLPVIRGQNKFCFLMTDKNISQHCTLKTEY